MLVLDGDLKIVTVNKAFLRAFGGGGNPEGRYLAEVRDPEWNVPGLRKLLPSVLSTGAEINDFEVRESGTNFLVNARRVDRDDDEHWLLLSFEDLLRQREEERHSARRARELEDDARRKDRWIAMLGHELRNPVGAVRNGIELLKADCVSPQQRQLTVKMMHRQIQQVAGLLDDLLDAARIISGKLVVAKVPVDMTGIARSAIEDVRASIDDHEHELKAELPPSESVWVSGDSHRLSQAIVNLLTNATKYTGRGGRITLEVDADDDTVTVKVADTGVGISDDLHTGIFEIFTQGPSLQDGADQGLGLGLPIVRTIAALHGGEVGVSSNEGNGSVFTITLPRLPFTRGDDMAVDDDTVPVTELRRILLVDDVPDAVESLQLLLQSYGYDVRTARDGPTAIDAAATFAPEAALLDLGMPGMTGYDLARRLRDEFPNVLLIAVSGYQKEADRLEAAGFDGHLIKPVEFRTLLKEMAAARAQTPD